MFNWSIDQLLQRKENKQLTPLACCQKTVVMQFFLNKHQSFWLDRPFIPNQLIHISVLLADWCHCIVHFADGNTVLNSLAVWSSQLIVNSYQEKSSSVNRLSALIISISGERSRSCQKESTNMWMCCLLFIVLTKNCWLHSLCRWLFVNAFKSNNNWLWNVSFIHVLAVVDSYHVSSYLLHFRHLCVSSVLMCGHDCGPNPK